MPYPKPLEGPTGSSFHNNNNNDTSGYDDDASDFYEDLPPKQIYMTMRNSSNNTTTTTASTSSVVSPLHNEASPKKISSKTIFSSQNLILDGHVWMGGMMHNNSATTNTTPPSPTLCTPDSTQTDQTQEQEDELPTPTTLGIGAAPFYNANDVTGDTGSSQEEGSTPTHSSFSNEQTPSDNDDDDDLSSSIPSFSTRRIILDLQDELARTKAELAHYKTCRNYDDTNPSNKDSILLEQQYVKNNNNSQDPLPNDHENDDSSVNAVVLAVPKKHPTNVVSSMNGAGLLQVRLDRSEERVVRLSAKLKETHGLARRLHGTLQRVKDRLQSETLPYQYVWQDVRFMSTTGHGLIFAFVVVAPMTLIYLADMAAFALVVGVTFSAVEIATRP